MILPQDIMDKLAELIKTQFPGEPVYAKRIPDDFERPSTYIELVSSKGNFGFGPSAVEIMPVIKVTIFSKVDDYRNSDPQELHDRLMTIIGVLIPGYIKVGTRAPKIQDMTFAVGLDYAVLTTSWHYALDRSEFLRKEQVPPAEHLNLTLNYNDRR